MKKINHDDMNNIDPITKFTKFGKFPYKLISHVLLVIFTTMQVVILISQTNRYIRAEERFFYTMFISNEDKRDDDYKKETMLYTPKMIRSHVLTSIENFYNINQNSIEITEYDSDDPFIIMDVSYISIKTNDNIERKESYIITKNDHGPFDEFDDMQMKNFLNSVSSFRLNYTVKTFVPNEDIKMFDCNLWKINQIYSFEARARFAVKLFIEKLTCENKINSKTFLQILFDKLIWIHVVVAVLAVYSLISTWNYISEVASLFIRVRMKNKIIEEHSPESDNSIYFNPLIDKEQDEDRESYQMLLKRPKPISKKIMKFNKWAIISLIGNIIQIFASLISIFDFNHVMIGTEILIGFGCFFAYLYIGRYFEFFEKYSAVYITIKKSLPNVARYFIGAAPLFIGFMLFGLCVFWKSSKFSSVSDVMIILFALANGDSIYDAFKDLRGVYFFIGQVYLYLFCIIFIVVVLNIFIAIVQEAYSSSQNETKEHWAYDKKENSSMSLPVVKVKKNESKIFNEEKEDLKDKINKEIKNIQTRIKSINTTAKEINDEGYEDVRDNIFEYISEDILTKVKEIKALLTDN